MLPALGVTTPGWAGGAQAGAGAARGPSLLPAPSELSSAQASALPAREGRGHPVLASGRRGDAAGGAGATGHPSAQGGSWPSPPHQRGPLGPWAWPWACGLSHLPGDEGQDGHSQGPPPGRGAHRAGSHRRSPHATRSQQAFGTRSLGFLGRLFLKFYFRAGFLRDVLAFTCLSQGSGKSPVVGPLGPLVGPRA